jgi:FXSXX-COOH protein
MQATDLIRTTAVSSKLADLRDIPLAEMPTLRTAALDEALGRVMPDSQTDPVPVAAFNSAI